MIPSTEGGGLTQAVDASVVVNFIVKKNNLIKSAKHCKDVKTYFRTYLSGCNRGLFSWSLTVCTIARALSTASRELKEINP